MEVIETIGQRVLRLRGGKSRRALAKAAGTHPAIIEKIEKGEMDLISHHLFNLAREFGIKPEELAGFAKNSPVELIEDAVKLVPLLEYAEAAKLADPKITLNKLKVKKHIPSTGEHTAMAFALRIHDDSMAPEFKPGDIVIVDPGKTKKPGSFVAASTNNGVAVFRKYRSRGADDSGLIFDLAPLNADYPTLESKKDGLVILGVLAEHRKPYID